MNIAKWSAVAALALPLACAAQEVWRCGPDGKSYSSVPCAEGRRLEVPETRPAADVADAHRRAAEERRQADTLTRERLARQAAQRGNGLAGMPARVEELKPVSARKAQKPPKPLRTAKHRPRPAA